MRASISEITKEKKGVRGRPKTTGKGTPILTRVHGPELAAIDAWIADQPDPKPTRPEAVRHAIRKAFF